MNSYRVTFAPNKNNSAYESIIRVVKTDGSAGRAKDLIYSEFPSALIREVREYDGIEHSYLVIEDNRSVIPIIGGTYILSYWSNGTKTRVAAVKHGPTWTLLYHAAIETYGKESLSYEFVPDDHADAVTF